MLQLRYLVYFPASLRALRPLERWLERAPFGAQYGLYAEKRPTGRAASDRSR